MDENDGPLSYSGVVGNEVDSSVEFAGLHRGPAASMFAKRCFEVDDTDSTGLDQLLGKKQKLDAQHLGVDALHRSQSRLCFVK